MSDELRPTQPPPPPQCYVTGVLLALGEDPTRDGLLRTPDRVVKSWTELYRGYTIDIPALFTVFEETHDEMVVLRDIEFYSMCEHHMLPFFGKAHVGYIPSGKIVGISKLARLVDAYARRLQVQERLGNQVAQALTTHLAPRGCGVVLEAQHLCMVSRGVGKQNSTMVTSSMHGLFRDDGKVKQEFLDMVRR